MQQYLRYGGVGLAVLAVMILALVVMTGSAAPQPQTTFIYTPGVSTTSNGIVRIDAWPCPEIGASMPPRPGTPPDCPRRIELVIDVPSGVLICKTSALGQTCRKLETLFAK